MTRNLHYVIPFLFLINQSFAQDEIFLKKTGKAMDIDLKILEVKNDSIYYTAFRKEKKIALTEVDKYRMNGKLLSAYPITPEQEKRILLLERQADSIPTVPLPIGAYMSLEEVQKKKPSKP